MWLLKTRCPKVCLKPIHSRSKQILLINKSMKTSKLNLTLSIAVIAAGVFVSHYIVTDAQTTTSLSASSSAAVSLSTLTYPISELGNCGSVGDCRTYCNNPQNQNACLAFAEEHHLMSQTQVSQAKQVLQTLATGGPGGCTTKDACENYCSDLSHASECLSFAEQHGLIQGPAVTMAQKMISLIQNGSTPGKCSSPEECRSYCSDSSHADECLAFAEKEGFISQNQLNAIKQTGGKGPGGCDSADSCAAFCNNPQNQSVCVDFAKQNGLISQVQAQNIQQSAVGLKIGLNEFPGQVVGCLKGELGDNAVGELESGNVTPNASTSAAVSSCLNLYKSQIQNRFQNLIQNSSSTIQGCLNGVSSSTVENLTSGDFSAVSPDQGERIRECLNEAGDQIKEQNQEQNQNNNQNEGERQQMEQAREQVKNQLENLPDRVKNCVMSYIGVNATTTGVGQIISNCMQTYNTSTPMGEGEGEGPAGMPRRPGNDNRPTGTSIQNIFNGGMPNPLPPVQQNDSNQGGGDN